MSLHDAVDPQIAALLTLVKGAVNAETISELGEEAVVGTYPFPIALESISSMNLPAVAIWRFEDRKLHETTSHIHDLATIRFDYYAPAVPLAALGDAWPLLRRVWEELVEAVCAGSHASVSGGAAILEAAGFVDIDINTARVRYMFAPNAGQAFPAFQGQITLEHREDPDLSGLADLVDLHATYKLKTEGESDFDIVEDITPKSP